MSDQPAAAPSGPPAAPPPQTVVLPRAVLLALALVCGVAVANVYLPQAITPLIGDGLGVSAQTAAYVSTAVQVGYAVGLFLFVPLGDRVRARPLLVTLLVATSAASLVAGLARSVTVLAAASVVIGLVTVAPQIVLPVTAGLVPERSRGGVTGTLLSGLLGGILLARTFAGTLGDWLGWRAPYLASAGLALLVAGLVLAVMPRTAPGSRQRYPALVAATLTLLRTEPQLRRSCFNQMTMFAAFIATWTTLTLLVTGPVYGRGTSVVGLIALVGAAGIVASPLVGRLVDRIGPGRVNGVAFAGALVASGILALAGRGGTLGLVALVLGVIVLDLSVQSGQVANQTRIFALPGDLRSRLNTGYMTCAFLGGSLGSWLGVTVFSHGGWRNVCLLVAGLAVVGLVGHTALERRG